MAYQSTTIVGNVGTVRELKPVIKADGTATCVLNFTVCVDDTWYNVAVWGKYAETLSKFIAKGHPVMVVGVLKPRMYADSNGFAAISMDLTADVVQDMARKEQGEQASVGGLRLAPVAEKPAVQTNTAEVPKTDSGVTAPKGKQKSKVTPAKMDDEIPF